MYRVLLIVVLQLVIVLSQRRYQGRVGRRTTWSFSNRRHGRSQEDETSDANFLPTYEEGSLDSENILIKEPEELNPTSEAIMVETTDAPILEDSPLTTMADKQPEEATKSLVKKYRNYGERCGSCDGQEENPLCGSDGHTYPNACELDLYACRKYWDITVVSEVVKHNLESFCILYCFRDSVNLRVLELILECFLDLDIFGHQIKVRTHLLIQTHSYCRFVSS